jgi:hypothetical protein
LTNGTNTNTPGSDFNRKIDDAATRIEQELKNFVVYVNDEVVPAVRQHSSRGLRIAAEKFREFADYLDQQQNNK